MNESWSMALVRSVILLTIVIVMLRLVVHLVT